MLALHKSAMLGLTLLALPFLIAEESRAAEWETTLQKARVEGQVVLGTNEGSPEYRRDLSNMVKGRYGIDVQVRSMGAAELTAIMSRECEAGRQSIDVVLSGNSELTSLYEKDCLAPVKPNLLLPEVVDASKWREGALKFNDPQGAYLLQAGEYVTIPGIYNETLSSADMDSVRILLNPKLKGKIASFDPRGGGAGNAVASYLLTMMGEQFVKDLYIGQKVVYTTNHRQLADWVARGTYLVGLAAQDRAFAPLVDQGLPIKILSFEDLKPKVTGGSSVLKLVKGSPHPNAAVVLLNWLASKEGQEVYENRLGQKSRRLDVHLPSIPAYMIPKDEVSYYDDYSYQNYAVERPKVTKKLIDILGR